MKPDTVLESDQIPNRDDSNLDTASNSFRKGIEDPTVIKRLVDQKRNFAKLQRKVSPLKVILDKERSPLIKRAKLSLMANSPNSKKIKMDNSSLFCPHCDKQFPLGGSWKLKKHIRNQHKIEADSNDSRKPGAKCNDCDKEFSSLAVLNSHLEQHKTSLPWTCKLCSGEFSEMTYIGKSQGLVLLSIIKLNI